MEYNKEISVERYILKRIPTDVAAHSSPPGPGYVPDISTVDYDQPLQIVESARAWTPR